MGVGRKYPERAAISPWCLDNFRQDGLARDGLCDRGSIAPADAFPDARSQLHRRYKDAGDRCLPGGRAMVSSLLCLFLLAVTTSTVFRSAPPGDSKETPPSLDLPHLGVVGRCPSRRYLIRQSAVLPRVQGFRARTRARGKETGDEHVRPVRRGLRLGHGHGGVTAAVDIHEEVMAAVAGPGRRRPGPASDAGGCGPSSIEVAHEPRHGFLAVFRDRLDVAAVRELGDQPDAATVDGLAAAEHCSRVNAIVVFFTLDSADGTTARHELGLSDSVSHHESPASRSSIELDARPPLAWTSVLTAAPGPRRRRCRRAR